MNNGSAKGFYVLLEVEVTATVDEIRAARRRLVFQHHPDVQDGSADANERMKAINRAVEVLSAPGRRALYDEFGEEGLKTGFDPGAARAAREATIRREAERAAAARAAEERAAARPRPGIDQTVDIRLDAARMASGGPVDLLVTRPVVCDPCAGGGRESRSCDRCVGNGRARLRETCAICAGKGQVAVPFYCAICQGTGVTADGLSRCWVCQGGVLFYQPQWCGPCNATGAIWRIEEQDCSACAGTGMVDGACSHCSGAGSTLFPTMLSLTLPPNLEEGSVVLFRGRGAVAADGSAGDLYVTVRQERRARRR